MSVSTLIQTAAVLVPIGINPLLAIALFGVATTLGVYAPPPGLAPFTEPAVWVTFLVLGLMLKMGRSTKLSKPLAEAFGSAESLFALGSGFVVLSPLLGATDGFTSAVVVLAGVLAMSVIILFRTALDVLSWLSPIPFLDLLLQLTKGSLTVGLVALAVFAPAVGLGLDFAFIVLAVLGARWAMRAARHGLTILYDLTLGRMKPKQALPRDAIMPEDLGPFHGFAVEIDRVPRHARVRLEVKVGRAFVTVPRLFSKTREIPLGDVEKAVFQPGALGTTVHLPQGKIVLPPRYRHLVDELRVALRAECKRSAQPLKAAELGARIHSERAPGASVARSR
jgi:hypothetical protein